ncbi:MAG: (2Fe-2S)-binding protein [Gemmatimonadaceae bacterium]
MVVDGRHVRVPSNCTVAVALFDLGVSAFRKSVSGQPRGPVCAMGVCFECRVTIDGTPHQRACLIPVADGMQIRTAGES